MGEPDMADSPVNYQPGERAGHSGLALGFQTMQDCIAQKSELLDLQAKQNELRLEELRTPIFGWMGWVKTEELNAQYREVLVRYPSTVGVCSGRSTEGIYSVSCEASAISG